ncbi:MAG: aminotransferase class I/II-fold pyridoxal phosphate-dependent enzyme [Gemmatimonadetes bacterium]|nr:aminotransferase class I/II-fold pyridoxal phosphate-dependent enzyme [Gemmatimonadota bacterium]
MTTSDRAQSCLIPEAAEREGNDPIFALHGEAVRRIQSGEAILNSTLGALMDDDGRLAVMPSVSEAIDRVPREAAAGYAPIAGDPAYVRAVIDDLYGGTSFAGDAVAVATPGSTGAIHHAVLNFLEPGQAALTPSYFWGPYDTISTHARRAVETFNMFDAETRLDLDAFADALGGQLDGQGRALVLFNFPCNNPTGYSLDDAEWAAVADIVRDAGKRGPVAFLLDHAYAKFGDEESNRWVDHVPTMLETATVLVGWTVSKSYAQYGARVGALVALHADRSERERIASALSFSCRATWSNCNHLGLLTTAELLTDPELRERSVRDRARMIELLDQRVGVFNELAADAGLEYPRYEGGFFVAVFTDDGEATAAAMRETGVYVVPMEGAVRAALCATPVAQVPRLVDALAEGVMAARGATV